MIDTPPPTPVPGRSARGAFVRYVILGLAQNAFFYLVSVGLIALGLVSWQALAITFPIGVLVSFVLNRAWSFAGRERMRGQFTRHVIVYGAAYPVSLAVAWLLELVTPAWLATGLTIGIVAVLIFTAVNFWVYPSRPSESPGTSVPQIDRNPNR